MLRIKLLLFCFFVIIILYSEAPAGEYYFPLHDHLGNTRVVVDKNKNVIERYDYYPFGAILRSTVSNTVETIQKFTGKELDDEHGVDLYYFGARFYDPITGRFTSTDPLAVKYPSLSPYNYCANNPLVLIDPDGRIIDTIADVGFIIYDIYDIGKTCTSGGSPSGSQWAALGADVAGALVPFATGAGLAIRSVAKADEIVDVAKAVDKAGDIGKSIDKISDSEKTYQVYIKVNSETGQIYVGRTSGFKSPIENVSLRDTYHHKTKEGFEAASIIATSNNPDAIRGLEQLTIEKCGGAQSIGGKAGNKIQSISNKNPKRDYYLEEAIKEFGESDLIK